MVSRTCSHLPRHHILMQEQVLCGIKSAFQDADIQIDVSYVMKGFKAELLRSLLLSVAAQHKPQEISTYKGQEQERQKLYGYPDEEGWSG